MILSHFARHAYMEIEYMCQALTEISCRAHRQGFEAQIFTREFYTYRSILPVLVCFFILSFRRP